LTRSTIIARSNSPNTPSIWNIIRLEGVATGRRGVAGTVIVKKIVGAAAEENRPLQRARRPSSSAATRSRWAWASTASPAAAA
jgi:dihydroxyacetone kinase